MEHMKLAILLPGYLDSPDYLHLKVFEKRLPALGYKVIRLDPCDLWSGGDTKNYTATNYLNHIRRVLDSESQHTYEEIVLIGHSFGGFISIIAGNKFPEVDKVVSLCPPSVMDGGLSKTLKNGFRISKRALPEKPDQLREFAIPVSFYDDAKQYSAVDSVKELHKPLMIFIGLEDTVVSPADTEKIITASHNPYVVRKEGIGHDFRMSEDESMTVMNEIENFLK
jgi:pimeloyl-ACP methyl ester carboxylesterase